MDDALIKELIKSLKDFVDINKVENSPDIPSTMFATFSQEWSKSQDKDRAQQERIANDIKQYELREARKANEFRRLFKSKSFFRDLGTYVLERRAKNELRRRYPRANEAEINYLYRRMPNVKGMSGGGFFGGIGTFIAGIAKFAKVLSNFAWVVTIFTDALKANGEARKFYVPSIRQGYGRTTGQLYDQSLYTLQKLRLPLYAGAYANNTQFKNAVAEIMSAGVLNDSTIRSKKGSEDLIRIFKFIGSQGLILGETFEETAKNFINYASIYDLSLSGNRNNLEGYKYINKLMANGISEGFSKTGLQQLLMQYDKSAAISQGGILKAFKDFEIMFKTVGEINPDRNQMPQYLSMFQNLMSGKVSNLSTFAALVDRSGAAYSKGQLNRLAEEYQESSGFAQKIIAFRNLQRMTGVGTALLTELNKSEFGAFANPIGRQVLDALVKNPNINRKYMNEARNLSPEEQAKWMQENLKDLHITDEDRLSIEKLAQVTEVMSNPLQTLVTLVTGILNFMYSLVSSGAVQWFVGDANNLNFGDAERFIDKTKTNKALNNRNRYS